MKNIKAFCGIALVAIMVMAVFSCGSSDGGESLSGTIEIQQYGSPVTGDVNTGSPLTAEYSDSSEAVTYQWKKNGVNISADKGGTSKTFTPTEPGKYTVTVSVPGKGSKTSKQVNVVGNAIPELPGDVSILKGSTPVTTAETGDTLTAFYDGTEEVAFQWFKAEAQGDVPVQNFASTVNANYTPTEPGSYFVKISLAGYGTRFSAKVEVSGISLITITFNLNGPGGTNPTRVIAPGEKITAREALPTQPAYNGFAFKGWYTELIDGEEIDEETVFNASATVYALWNFAGGTPYYDAATGTVVHENPMMEISVSNASRSTEDGAITFSSGGYFSYKWPTDAEFGIGDYAYCIVRYEIKSYTDGTGTDPKGGSGVKLMRYDGAGYPKPGLADNGNDYPWLTNLSSSGFRFPLSGAGDSGGFRIGFNGSSVAGATIVVRITNITFYKLPLYTVTFDLNGGDGPTPASVTLYEDEAIGTTKFPANPTKEDYTFMGWKNPAGTIVNATTPIKGNWVLTANWMKTSELPTPKEEVAANGTLFAASGDSTATKFTYDGKQWWVIAKTPKGSPTAVAPFDGTAAADYTAALAAADNYARINYSLSTLGGDIWQSFSKVTLTYDLIMVGGTDTSITVRNGVGAGGEPSPGNSTFAVGSDQTITFDTSAFGTGNLALVKNNSGSDSLFLLRITKVELFLN